MNSIRVSNIDTVLPLIHAYNECILRLNQMMNVLSNSIEHSDVISMTRVLQASDDIYAKMDELSGRLQVLFRDIDLDTREIQLSPIRKEIEANLRDLAKKQAACLAALDQSKTDCKTQITELATYQSLSKAYQRQCTRPTSRFLDSKL